MVPSDHRFEVNLGARGGRFIVVGAQTEQSQICLAFGQEAEKTVLAADLRSHLQLGRIIRSQKTSLHGGVHNDVSGDGAGLLKQGRQHAGRVVVGVREDDAARFEDSRPVKDVHIPERNGIKKYVVPLSAAGQVGRRERDFGVPQARGL